jgi:predicted lipoprotein with Yx(FWY)xxD motif
VQKPQVDGVDRYRLALRVTGGGLLVATGAIHLDLYLNGYRSIPTIGVLFLLQVITAFGLGGIVLATGSRLAAAAGAVFAISTLGGYLLSLRFGLFGFREVRTGDGVAAALIEVSAFAVLAALALAPGTRSNVDSPASRADRSVEKLQEHVPYAGWAVAAFSVLATVVLGIALSAAGSTNTSSSGALLKATTIRGVTVLTNARGFTLYWFVPDTPIRSNCNGLCAQYWPPVTGRPSAGSGVTGQLGTIKRSDGVTQATYDSHPLYTYIGDSGPGESNGNNIDLNGGVWRQMAESG